MEKSYWIWFPGDLELYYGMQQNFSREERGFSWPAYWKADDWRKNVTFRKVYELEEETTFVVASRSLGYVLANEKKYPFGKEILCPAGRTEVVIHAASMEVFPSIYVAGERIVSDGTWLVDDYVHDPVKVGWNETYTEVSQNPAIWEYDTEEYRPVRTEEIQGGTLYTFIKEITASLCLDFKEKCTPVTLCYGESKKEALDTKHCYYSQRLAAENDDIPVRAFRYLYVPEVKPGDLEVRAIHHYVDIPVRAEFSCDNQVLNRIWEVSEWTFKLCSGIFFIDGAKRDKWIWSADAYQSFFVNQYLFANPEINKRTLLALRGNDAMETHINTILDYSLFWIIGIHCHYLAYGDLEFVEAVYPKMVSLMEFCERQTDQNGFLVGRDKDWTFIDWADIDKEGAVCGEQVLYAQCFFVMEELGRLLGADSSKYGRRKEQLRDKIQAYYWDQEKQAFIDSFSSGKRNVTRQTNILAYLYQVADEKQKDCIIKNVLLNDAIPPITTPYFKFYEMEALCQGGYAGDVKERIIKYWGGMLQYGVTTFWEEFDERKAEEEQYEMYGDPYGKSLCHAWAASPIYLIGRYFMGIAPLKPGYGEFEVRPNFALFQSFKGNFPVGKGQLYMEWSDGSLNIRSSCSGGRLLYGNQVLELEAGKEYTVSVVRQI